MEGFPHSAGTGAFTFQTELNIENHVLKNIFDSIALPIFLKPKNGPLFANNAFATFVGIQKDYLNGKTIHDIYPDSEAEMFLNDYQEIILTGLPKLGVRQQLIAKNGIRWVQIDKMPYHNPAGEVAGVIGFFSDITDQVSEENLQAGLKKIDEVLFSTYSSEEIMRSVVTDAALALGCDSAAISFRENNEWHVKYVYGFPDKIVGTIMNDSDEPHAAMAIRTKKVIAINDAFNDERVNPDHMKAWNIKSVMVVPLVAANNIEGVIFFNYQKQAFEFKKMHTDFGGKLAITISLALANAKLFEQINKELSERKKTQSELTKLNRSLKSLSDIHRALHRSRTEKEYLNEVCRIIVDDCGHSLVWIGFAENNPEKSIRPAAFAGLEAGYLKNLNATWADKRQGRGPTGKAIRTGKPSKCKDIKADPAFQPWKEEAIKRNYSSSLALPLISEGRAFGAISVYSHIHDSFTEEEVEIMTELADEVAYGISVIRLRTAHEKSEKDLKSSEDKLRNMFDNSPLGMMLLNLDGKIIDCNNMAAMFYGSGMKELLIGREFASLFYQNKEIAEQMWNDLMQTGSINEMDAVLTKSDGIAMDGLIYATLLEEFPGKPYVLVIVRDITERKRIQDKLRRTVDEKEILLKEIHHRVKNNLQMISSLLHLQTPGMDRKTLEILKESQSRIKSIGLLHEIMYATKDFSNIDLAIYLKELASRLIRTYQNEKISLIVEGGNIFVNISDAMPCGLIVNELLMNSMKHAFQGGQGTIKISLSTDGRTNEVEVSDNGAGFPPGFKIEESSTLGLKLVHSLSEQLDGSIAYKNEHGTIATLHFPVRNVS